MNRIEGLFRKALSVSLVGAALMGFARDAYAQGPTDPRYKFGPAEKICIEGIVSTTHQFEAPEMGITGRGNYMNRYRGGFKFCLPIDRNKKQYEPVENVPIGSYYPSTSYMAGQHVGKSLQRRIVAAAGSNSCNR